MEIQFYGGNCIRITTKKASMVVDDTLAALGTKSITKPEDIVLSTQRFTDAPDAKLAVDGPGEYEVSGVSIVGVAARSHMDEEGVTSATMYKVDAEDIRVAVVGHVHPDLTADELEALGTIDVLMVPVGGSGYTLDGIGALKVVKAIEPKIVIPTHYADKALSYEVPQQSLEDALKGMGMEAAEKASKLKLKPSDLPEVMQLIVLER